MRWLRWHLCRHLGKAAASQALRGEGRAPPVSAAVQRHLAGSGPPGPVPEAPAPRPAQTPTPDAACYSRRSGPCHTCPCGGPWGSLARGRTGHVAFGRSSAELAAALSTWGASAGGAPTACGHGAGSSPLAPGSPCVARSLCPRTRPPGSRPSPRGRDSTEAEALGCGRPHQPPDPPQAGAPRPAPGRCPQTRPRQALPSVLLPSGQRLSSRGGVCAGRRYVRGVDAEKARPASQQCWSLGPRALLLAGLRRAGADSRVRGWGGKASDHTDHSPGPPRPISWSRSPGPPGVVSPKNQRQRAPPAGGADHPPGRDVRAWGHHALGGRRPWAGLREALRHPCMAPTSFAPLPDCPCEGPRGRLLCVPRRRTQGRGHGGLPGPGSPRPSPRG